MKTNSIKAVKLYLLWFIAMIIIFGGISWYVWPETMQLNKGLIYIFFALQQLLTLMVLWWSLHLSWWSGRDKVKGYFEERAQRKGRWLFWKRVVWGFLFYILLNAVLYLLIQTLGVEIPWFYGEQWVQVMLQEMNITGAMDWIITILMIVIVWPIVEEMVYRGLITDALMQKRRWGGVFLAAAIFALIHMDPNVMWNLFILALILWVIYYKTWSMRYAFLFHVIINGMWVFVLWLSENGLMEGV